jgi:hypothetical protein
MWVRIVVAALLAWNAGGPASAQPSGAPTGTPAPSRPGADVIPLSLHEAIALGIDLQRR